jgi:LysR family transcriptional regulator, benzoate and cis,cis-muconate-responsive activator of ben and cat genes
MDLKQLRCFVTLADVANIRRAAGLLALSQPALSMRIQRLEQEVGYALFERQARSVSLSERGTRLLPHVKRLLAHGAAAEQAASRIGQGAFDYLQIGLTPIAALSTAPAALRRFRQHNPGVELALVEGLSEALEEAVAHRRLDFAIVHPPSSRDDVILREIDREAMVAVLPANHPLAERHSIGAADLASEVVVGVRRDVGAALFDRIGVYLKRAGVTAPLRQSASTSISLIGLVAAGAGVGLVIESLACVRHPDVRFVPLHDEPPTLGYALCHRSDLPDALRRAFVASMVESARDRSQHAVAAVAQEHPVDLDKNHLLDAQ